MTSAGQAVAAGIKTETNETLRVYTLNQYQEEVVKLKNYPKMDEGNLLYPALGLAGESGEVVDKIKKLWRNSDKTSGKQLTHDEFMGLVKELGDVLWYIAALADELGTTLESVANINLDKLSDRLRRGVVKSEGDNR